MKIIKLISLRLLNFKGVKEFYHEFDAHETNIIGANRTGKSTILDGFLWALFGKNSSDKTDFSIKTLDKNNNALHELSHEVELALDVDGRIIKARRVYMEKWTKKKGNPKKEFTGHEKEHYWDDVPVSETQYIANVNGLLNEGLFKLITNTSYFNQLRWQDRREALLQMAGTITNEMVFDKIVTDANNHQFSALIAALNANKTEVQFRLQIGAQKKKIIDEIESIPSRLDEAKRSLPAEQNYQELQTLLDTYNESMLHIDEALTNASAASKEHLALIQSKTNEVATLRRKLTDIEQAEKKTYHQGRFEQEEKLKFKRYDLTSIDNQITRKREEIEQDSVRVHRLEADLEKLRADWVTEDDKDLVFDEAKFACPTCKRAYEESDIEKKKSELISNFNQTKSNLLASLMERGNQLGENISVINSRLDVLTEEGLALAATKKELEAEIVQMQSDLDDSAAEEEALYNAALGVNQEYADISIQIENLTVEINKPYSAQDTSDIQRRKKELNEEIDGLKKLINTKEQRQKTEARIAELENQQRTQHEELTRLEGIEFSIDTFVKAKMNMVESRINDKFKIVKFKMYRDLVNGGEEPCCETLIDGVPYADANTASKVQAGLDIINALSEYHKVSAPIFIDNRESVTDIPATKSQIVNLIVKNDQKDIKNVVVL